MKTPVCLMLALMGVPFVASAQDNTNVIENIVVTATRTAQAADEVVAPVVVIDRATIARSMALDVADLLKFHAGLDIARNGGPGQPTSVFIRGTESNHTLVLIDGVKINPGTAGGAALERLPTDQVERIEIVKGPRSSLYGSEAIGGVINIITRGESGPSGVGARLGSGHYATRNASVDARVSGSRGALGAGASWLTTDGFPIQTGSMLSRGHENRTLNLFAALKLGTATLKARHWATRGNTEYLDFLLAPLDQDFTNQVTSVQFDAAPAAGWQTSTSLSRTLDEVRQNHSPDFFITDRRSLDWQNDIQTGAHQLTAGLYLSTEDTRAASWGSGYDETTRVNAAYLQDQVTLGEHELVAAARHTDHETAGKQNTWNLDYAFNFTPNVRLTAGLGTGFRAPDSSERFGFGGNVNLRPETSRNMEFGASYRPDHRQQFWFRAFRNEIDNLIEYVVLDFMTYAGINRNVARARIQGLEAGYEIRDQDWEFRVEAVSQDPRDLDTDQLLLRRSKTSLSASLVRKIGHQEIGVDMLTSGPRKDFGFPTVITLPGYTLVNLNGRVGLGQNWWLQAKLENLLDRQYQTVSGYTTAGRGVYLSFNYASY